MYTEAPLLLEAKGSLLDLLAASSLQVAIIVLVSFRLLAAFGCFGVQFTSRFLVIVEVTLLLIALTAFTDVRLLFGV